MVQQGAAEWTREAVRLGRELRQHRERAGLTQKQLAERAAIHRSYVTKIELGQAGQFVTRQWLLVLTKVVLDERARWEAELRLQSATLQERIDNMVAAEVSRRMRMAR